MRLLHIVDRFGWSVGGGDLYIERLLGPLEDRGIESVVAYFNWNPARSWRHLTAYHIPELMHFNGPARNGISKLGEVIREHRPDIAFLHCLPNPFIGLTLVQLLPTIYYALDYMAVCPAGTQWLRLPNQPCTRTTVLTCLLSAYTTGCSSRRPLRLFSAYKHTRAARRWLP